MGETVGSDANEVFRGEPWSLGAMMNGLMGTKDADGRPLGEGRAPVEAKDGVPMTTRRCPYPDERQGRWMNVSALTQITGLLNVVLPDIADLRSHLSSTLTWKEVALTVLDRMAAPAVILLAEDNPEATISAMDAVGYKVAVGYSIPVRMMLKRELAGDPLPVTVEAFHRVVRAERSLVGAREVCAAPNHMLDRVTATFLCAPNKPPSQRIPKRRVELARLLAEQLTLGLRWENYDLAMERKLLLAEQGGKHLSPRTPFLVRSLEQRLTELEPASFDFNDDRRADSEFDQDSLNQVRASIAQAAAGGSSPIQVSAGRHQERVFDLFAEYLAGYCAFTRLFIELEQQIRTHLQPPTRCSGPVRLDRGLLPPAKCLRWFELSTGQRLRIPDAPLGQPLLLRSAWGSVELPASLWGATGSFVA